MNKNGKEVVRETNTVVPNEVEAVCDIGKAHVYEFKLNAEKFAPRSSGEPSSIISRRTTRAATNEQEDERKKAKRNATHVLARGVTKLRRTQCLAYFLQVNYNVNNLDIRSTTNKIVKSTW